MEEGESSPAKPIIEMLADRSWKHRPYRPELRLPWVAPAAQSLQAVCAEEAFGDSFDRAA